MVGKRSRQVDERKQGGAKGAAASSARSAAGEVGRGGGRRQPAAVPGEPVTAVEVGVMLGRLGRAARARAAADAQLVEHVRSARGLGVSWHQIGLAVGMTGEGARKRYGGGR